MAIADPIFEVRNLTKEFVIKNGLFSKPAIVKATNDVSFKLHKGETYAIVGESGCGKSTTGRAALRLIEPTSGEILYHGNDISYLNQHQITNFRQKTQMVFQDPYSSLNPRMTVDKIVEEPLSVHKIGNSRENRELAEKMLIRVGIRKDQMGRYPHEFSGGQKQRISLARALVLKPEIIICDEPVSALDVSIQAQVLNLMRELQEDMGVSYVFISHDMSVVKYISDRIGVMYLGNLIEEAETEELFRNPIHPYTKALLSAVPEADTTVHKRRITLEGEIPSPLNVPSGCPFRTRCLYSTPLCAMEKPKLKSMADDHMVACHYE